MGHALTPGLYHRLAPVMMNLLGTGRGQAEDTTGNVYEPMPDCNQIRGGWRRLLAVRLAAGALTMGAAATVWERLR